MRIACVMATLPGRAPSCMLALRKKPDCAAAIRRSSRRTTASPGRGSLHPTRPPSCHSNRPSALAREPRRRATRPALGPPEQSRSCTIACATSRVGQHLSRVEQSARIQQRLDAAHHVDGVGAELGHQIFRLAVPYAVFAGAGAAETKSSFDEPGIERLGQRQCLGIAAPLAPMTATACPARTSDETSKRICAFPQ